MNAAEAKTQLHIDISDAGLSPVADAADYESQFDACVTQCGNNVDKAYAVFKARMLAAAAKLKGPING